MCVCVSCRIKVGPELRRVVPMVCGRRTECWGAGVWKQRAWQVPLLPLLAETSLCLFHVGLGTERVDGRKMRRRSWTGYARPRGVVILLGPTYQAVSGIQCQCFSQPSDSYHLGTVAVGGALLCFSKLPVGQPWNKLESPAFCHPTSLVRKTKEWPLQALLQIFC